MIVLNFWQMAAAVAASAAFGFAFALVVLYHPGRPEPAQARPAAARPPAPLPLAGYLPGDNTGCYEPRTDWPEPDWPADTFSEISAGWDRLERNVAAQTAPIAKIQGKYTS